MELQHNLAPYFNSKLDFIMSEFARLQEALGVEDTVRLAVDLKLQVEFAETTITEAPPCGSQTNVVKNILVGSKKFPALLMDDFIGAVIIDNNCRIFELDPDNRSQEFAAPASVKKVGGTAKTKKKRTEADGGSAVPGAGAQALLCAPPIEIPLTHPFLAKSRVQFIDDALLVKTVDSQIVCEECPNVFKSHPLYKHATLPTLLRSIPSDETPLPDDFRWADLPDADNDELKCLCQGERIIIEEMTFPEIPPPPPALPLWSNFCGDADGIPATPGATVDPALDGLLGLITAEAIVVARADSDAWLQTFCCPTQITPEVPDCEELDLKSKAPFENVTLLTDGGEDLPLVRGGEPMPKYVEKAKARRVA